MTRPRDERGSALITVVLVGVVLAVIGSSLMRGTFADLGQTERSQATNRSLQAAEAGINDYVSKLTEDHLYYAHWVHRAEATRTANGTTYDPAASPLKFDGTLTWTYDRGRDGWLDLGDGLEYDLQVYPPTADRATVRIVATGRRTGNPSSARTLEALVRTASVADFQMIANADVVYGATTTTDGKIYAGAGSRIVHSGTANANLYAEGSIYGQMTAVKNPDGTYAKDASGNFVYAYSGRPTYGPGAVGYDATTIRTVIKAPIDFNAFTGSIGNVLQAASSGGIVLDDTTAAGWWITFLPGGTLTYQRCTAVDLSATAPVDVLPTCGAPTTKAVPTNGAIYAGQDVIVSGTVAGRVTVASAGNVVVGGNIAYQTDGSDVLGLMGSNGILVPQWAPYDLTWRAATLAVANMWRSVYPPLGTKTAMPATHGTMIFKGSTAANLGGYMNEYGVRKYQYDDTLLYLQPPYFPVLEDAYTIQLLREVH